MAIFVVVVSACYCMLLFQGRGKKCKSTAGSMSMDWELERQEGVQVLLSLIQLPLTKLWDPPVAEEEFVRYCDLSFFFSL